MKTKAYLYLRLSVDEEGGQAQSIEVQRFEAQKYARANDIEIIEEFIDAGVSGRRTSRPGFDLMIAKACAMPSPVSVVLTYRLDRFARNQQVFHKTVAKLETAHVDYVSVTEAFGKGRTARFGMSVSAIFAEQQSIAASIHTSKSRRENARQGFWNGGPVPYGYETYIAAQVGKKSRMKLRLVETEATVIRQIFYWALQGHGGRKIVAMLHERGLTMRGRKFSNGSLAGLLAREHYAGQYFDRTADEDGKRPLREAWIEVPCPAIVSLEDMQSVAAMRSARSPRVVAPHIAAGTSFLVGVARCGAPSCQCSLTVRSGKAGRYHYYTCANRVNAAIRCDTPNVRREKLDAIVIHALEKRLLKPERLQKLLSNVLDMSNKQRRRARKRSAAVPC